MEGVELCSRKTQFLTGLNDHFAIGELRRKGIILECGIVDGDLVRILIFLGGECDRREILDALEANYEKIQKKIGYLPQEIDLYPSLTVRECLEYMGDLAGIEKRESKKRIDYYLEKTSLADHQKKKMRQLSGGMKRRVGLVQALLHEPDFLIVDEPTTGLDPEERIRIRNLLVDFAEERTVLFSTHVVEDLMATCNQLAVMKKGRFLYTGTMRELLNKARGHVWECCTEDESLARELERKYHISSKQYTEEGIRLRLLGENMPSESGCIACDVTLEDAYIYVTNR